MKTKMTLLMASVIMASPALAAVTPISGSVDAQAWARIGSVPGQIEQLGPASSSSWATLQPGTVFGATSTATVVLNGGLTGINASSSAYRNIDASWSSATAGRVRAEWGWAFAGVSMQKAASPEQTSAPSWTYAFTLATPAELTLNAVRQSSASDGMIFGLNSLYLYLSNAGPVVVLDQDLDQPFSSVTETVLLAPGDYQLGLGGLSGISGIFGDHTADAEMDIAWAINPISGAVPEPASWAMLIAGFGLTGAAMRRRNQKAQLRVVAA